MIAEMIVFDIPWKQFRGTDRDNVRGMKWRLRADETYFKFVSFIFSKPLVITYHFTVIPQMLLRTNECHSSIPRSTIVFKYSRL